MNDYQRIATAIEFIHSKFPDQPNLENVAAHIHLSPFHFQRMFREWAGVSPKKFLQYISIRHAKYLLEKKHSLADTAYETGLSGTSRLHDLFVTIEGMTPGEFKNGAERLSIQYSVTASPFGKILIGSTPKGICNIFFCETESQGIAELKDKWPNANISKGRNEQINVVSSFFKEDWDNLPKVKLHLKGTGFQLKVWEALLKIQLGELTTYADIASVIHHPRSFRAVGTAIGSNPVAFLIPCHRVIKATGIIGEYNWGTTRKKAIIGWESSRQLGEAI
jgi:AraC family transcriptional regulator of adaptative response/methylated-DNA-[protein]-cysteine methyltransferase